MQKGTQWVSSIMSSRLQFELERIGAPFACVTVEHGALREGHIPFCVYQDYCIGPEVDTNKQKQKKSDEYLRMFGNIKQSHSHILRNLALI